MFVHGDRLEGRVDGDEDSDDIAPVGRRNRPTASLSAVREIEEGGGGHLVCQTEVRGDAGRSCKSVNNEYLPSFHINSTRRRLFRYLCCFD